MYSTVVVSMPVVECSESLNLGTINVMTNILCKGGPVDQKEETKKKKQTENSS